MAASCKILIVEDSEGKCEEITSIVSEVAPDNVEIIRASTVMEAEAAIVQKEWTVVILDISMNITQSSSGARQGGHDTTGGLKVARKMFLLGREAPTIIVTAFDSFPSGEIQRNRREILGLEDVQRRASETLREFFMGCVRYGEDGWKDLLRNKLEAVLAK